MKIVIAAALLVLGMVTMAYADFGHLGASFGRLGAVPHMSSGTPAGAGKILLVNGVSFILQTDAASKICRAGGC